MAERPDLGFVACIESGVLEAQTLLLFESIRLHAGRFGECALYALSPRPGHAISPGTRRRLEELGAVHVDAALNTECPEYGPANRVAAAAYIEGSEAHELLVVVDSDSVFLREPYELALAPDVDVAARPVDAKGISTEGAADSFEPYWRDLCRLGGVEYEAIPWTTSFADRRRIKAHYNGGLVVVRRELGILRRAADLFLEAYRRGLRSGADGDAFRTGVGTVGPAAIRLWGSSQASLSVAIWGTTRRVRELPPTYNYPLHHHQHLDGSVFRDLVHVHYHWLLEEAELAGNPLFGADSPLSAEQVEWLRAAAPLA